MCGITGFIDVAADKNAEQLSGIVENMSDTLKHRGPDSGGIWVDAKQGVALGHRRLAIIDLNSTGHQPMLSSTGRYVITFNGEIYNFQTIKKKLAEKGRTFKGSSDTEVLLSAIEEWGLQRALVESNGMFAFALWDKKEKVLHLARDRMGKKPLYYGWFGNTLLFGSELKAIRANPAFTKSINRNALAAYVRHNYIPYPHSIYEGVFKLPPASFISIPEGKRANAKPQLYWDIMKAAKNGCDKPLTASFEEIVDELDTVLGEAVTARMVSDVPLGAFLSGGIDSSLVTALMQKHSTTPVKTFSIGFEESGYNEAPDARKIAGHLGTEHMEYFVTAEEARNVIPDLPLIYDEPFADPSQIPTYHVSRLARKHVTVALSGDGGDEGFAGYSRYVKTDDIGGKIYKLPGFCRHSLKSILRILPVHGRMKRLEDLLAASNQEQFYRRTLSYWQYPESLVNMGIEPETSMSDSKNIPDLGSYINKMMYMDMRAYLTDDILAKVDRASMAVSLETRAPLLDYKVIEYAWQIPLALKIDKGTGKWPLRALLERYVPKTHFDRPKQGFGIPHGEWLKGPLREWAEELLGANRIETEGYFNAEPVRQKWEEHLAGKDDWGYQLWGILMFQAWLEKN